MIRENSPEAFELEKLVDTHSMRDVLIALGAIAFVKSAHVAEAWQDMALSRKWFKAGNALDKFVDHQAIVSLP